MINAQQQENCERRSLASDLEIAGDFSRSQQIPIQLDRELDKELDRELDSVPDSELDRRDS